MTRAEALAEGASRLSAAGIDSPRREARLLLALALRCPPETLVAAAGEVAADAVERFRAFVARRVDCEPYSRIAGKREFWSLDFELSPDTLDPRPDSETLIETALARIPDRRAALQVIDFGTGTGALLLALLSELPNARGIGVDLLPGAAATARRNAQALGLGDRAGFAVGRWGEGLSARVDVIVANPPYISGVELARLAPEVIKFDPRAALDGGPDGLRAYRELAPDVARLLKPDGFAAVEIGAGQAGDVSQIMVRSGLKIVAKPCDLAGMTRCLVVEKRRELGNS